MSKLVTQHCHTILQLWLREIELAATMIDIETEARA